MKESRIRFISLLLLVCVLVSCLPASAEAAGNNSSKKVALVLDSDVGTDDSQAILLMKSLGINPDFIVATGGNGTADDVLRNAVILKKYLGFSSQIVRGKEITLSSEKNTFHGPDGFAGISSLMIDDYEISEEELNDYISAETLTEKLKAYDAIEYIAIGPLTTLSALCEDEEINRRIDTIYLMGGGINEFNCSHETEFNFSKNPEAVKTVLGSGNNIILFTLDLTNHQTLDSEQIESLEETDNLSEYVELLLYNLEANEEFNQIDAAVLHDTMPILYYSESRFFKTQQIRVTCDDYGHLEVTEKGGYPVTYVSGVDADLLFDEMMDAFMNVVSAEKADGE